MEIILQRQDTLPVMFGEPRCIFLETRRICTSQENHGLDILHQSAGNSSVLLAITILCVQRQLIEVLQDHACRASFLANRLHLV